MIQDLIPNKLKAIDDTCIQTPRGEGTMLTNKMVDNMDIAGQ